MRCAALVWIALAGCSGVDSTALPSAVTGRYEYRYVDHTPLLTVPKDLSPTTFQVYVVDDSIQGGFARFPSQGPVTGNADGTFEIDDVPAGPFWLRMQIPTFRPLFEFYPTHDVLETYDVLGRPDAVPLLYSQTTPLALEVSGISAWAATDYLIADCWGNATENYSVASSLMPSLPAGATSITASFDWSRGYSWGPSTDARLMAARDGDFLLSRTTNRTSGSVTSQTLTQVMMAPAPDQAAGSPSTIRGVFVDVPLDHSVALDIDSGAIVGALPAGNTITSVGVSLLAGPGTASDLALGPNLYEATSSSSLHLNVSYGNPFDPAWPLVVTGAMNLTQPLLGPEWSGLGYLRSAAVLENGSYTFVTPPMPHAPTLDGFSLDGQAVSWDGVSPLQLEMNAGEAASGMSADVIDVTPGRASMVIATIYAPSSPLLFPPELMHIGTTYALRLGVGDGRTPRSGAFVMTPPFTLVSK